MILNSSKLLEKLGFNLLGDYVANDDIKFWHQVNQKLYRDK